MKISRPVLYTALAGIAVAAFVLNQEEPAKVAAKVKSKKSTTSTVKDKYGFDEWDRKVKSTDFPQVTITAKNAFQPEVIRTKGAAEVAIAPDAVPAELASGDPNWFYTGNAELDGKPTALLDNRVTMESEFVSQGQKWKRCTIVKIEPQALVLAGPSGRKVKLTLSTGDMTVYPGTPRMASGYQPVNPALNGPIGGSGVNVRPDRTGGRNNIGVEARDAN